MKKKSKKKSKKTTKRKADPNTDITDAKKAMRRVDDDLDDYRVPEDSQASIGASSTHVSHQVDKPPKARTRKTIAQNGSSEHWKKATGRQVKNYPALRRPRAPRTQPQGPARPRPVLRSGGEDNQPSGSGVAEPLRKEKEAGREADPGADRTGAPACTQHNSDNGVAEPPRKEKEAGREVDPGADTGAPEDTQHNLAPLSTDATASFARQKRHVFLLSEEGSTSKIVTLFKDGGFIKAHKDLKPRACALVFEKKVVISTPFSAEREEITRLLGRLVGPPITVTESDTLTNYRRLCTERYCLPQDFPPPRGHKHNFKAILGPPSKPVQEDFVPIVHYCPLLSTIVHYWPLLASMEE
jgi:hypothetical protein